MRRRRAARWRGRRRRRERWRNRRRRTRARRGRAPPTARRGVRSRVCWAQARRQRVRGDSRQTVAPVRPPRARLQHDPRLRVVLRSGVLRLRCTPPSRERCPCPRRAVLPHLAAQVERRMAAAAVSRRENKKYFLTCHLVTSRGEERLSRQTEGATRSAHEATRAVQRSAASAREKVSAKLVRIELQSVLLRALVVDS